MKITKIAGIDFSDLSVGHLILLSAECDMVTAQLTGVASFPPSDFRKAGLRVISAAHSIATTAGSENKAARTVAEVDEIAERLGWDVYGHEFTAAMMHALGLIPAKPGQSADPGEKKLTG